MILSLLYRLPPDRCRLSLSIPTILELRVYQDIHPLLTPSVTEPRRRSWRCPVVCKIYAIWRIATRAIAPLGVRTSRATTGERLVEAAANARSHLTRNDHLKTPASIPNAPSTFEDEGDRPHSAALIVVIIDEMADLILGSAAEIEAAVQRLARCARRRIHVIHGHHVPLGRRHHRHHQGQPSHAHLVPGDLDDRQPTILARPVASSALAGRHALHAGVGKIARVHWPVREFDTGSRSVRAPGAQGVPSYI